VKRIFCIVLVGMLSVSGCKKRPYKKDIISRNNKSDVQTVESVHKEQSRKEAALTLLRRQHTHSDISGDALNDALHAVRCIEARCTDIAVPLQAQPVEQQCVHNDDGSIALVYDVALPLDTLLTFFSHEMERAGWSQKKLYNRDEYTLLYTKPGKIAIISVRPPTHKSRRTHKVVITQFYVQH